MRRLRLLQSLFFGVFVLPLLSLLTYLGRMELPPFSEWKSTLVWSSIQSAASASISLVIGFFLALLLLSSGRRWTMWLMLALLLPGFFPPLMIVLTGMQVTDWLGLSSLGLGVVVFCHALMNVGLVAVGVYQLVVMRLKGMIELATVESAPYKMIVGSIILRRLWRELAILFFLVFSMCFNSFSIPLILGGDQTMSFEVLVYQKVRVYNDWNQALFYVFFEMFFVSCFIWLLPKQDDESVVTELLQFGRWPMPMVFAFCLAPLLLVLFSELAGVLPALTQLHLLSELGGHFWVLSFQSLYLGFAASFVSVLLCWCMGYLSPWGKLRKVFQGLSAPSAVVVGFGLMLLFGDQPYLQLVSLVLGLSILFFPYLYRWQLDPALQRLQSQVEMAKVMGAGRSQIFWDILRPQLVSPVGFIAGVMGFWVIGEFALVQLMTGKELTLAVLAQGLLERYRLDLGSIVILWTITLGFVNWLFIGGVVRVFSHRS